MAKIATWGQNLNSDPEREVQSIWTCPRKTRSVVTHMGLGTNATPNHLQDLGWVEALLFLEFTNGMCFGFDPVAIVRDRTKTHHVWAWHHCTIKLPRDGVHSLVCVFTHTFQAYNILFFFLSDLEWGCVMNEFDWYFFFPGLRVRMFAIAKSVSNRDHGAASL